MDTTLDKIMKARTLRSMCKKEGTTSDQMQAYIDTMSTIALELQEAEEKAAKDEKMKKEAIEAAVAQLKEVGVTARDLVSAFDAGGAKTKSRTAKYTYTDEGGEKRGWTGQGRIPIPMQKQMDEENLKKEDFLTQPHEA